MAEPIYCSGVFPPSMFENLPPIASGLIQSGYGYVWCSGISDGLVTASGMRVGDMVPFTGSAPIYTARERGIRDALPFASGTPTGIIADWLEEQSRHEAADYLRKYGSKP